MIEEVRQKCLERGVAVVGGGIFFTQTPKEACFRLNCARATPEDLARGMEIFCETVTAAANQSGGRKSRT